jgi:two-component system, NarL family, invasion response regulator UvrY
MKIGIVENHLQIAYIYAKYLIMNSPVILLADDHVIIRRGMKFLIDSHYGKFTIIETESIKGLKALLNQHTFSHLILDMQLRNGNVIEILEQIRKEHPDVMIMIYTMSPEDIFGKRMIQLGADSFLSKQSAEEEVLHALDLFFKGKKYLSKQLDEILMNENSQKVNSDNPIKQLSDREIQVLSYLLKGEGVSDIAARLNIKPNTVGTFKARIFDKLGVSNLFDLNTLVELYDFHSS